MKLKYAFAAGAIALPMLLSANAFAQAYSADCDLTLRYVSEQEPKVVDAAARADVKKLWLEAQIAQKANDTRLCVDKLDQAMTRGNIPKR